MKPKNNMGIYTCIWIIAIMILSVSLFQNIGDAKVINYSGIVRGATQKLVKEELMGHPDDKLIVYLDSIITELRTGHGTYGLNRVTDSHYQQQLKDMDEMWQIMKQEIQDVRLGKSTDRLYTMSQEYFEKADAMVASIQGISDRKLSSLMQIFTVYLILTIGVFYFWYRYKQRQIKKAMYVDQLTGISNMSAFEIYVEQKIKENPEIDYAMICVDIDDFKFLNTTYGIELGDQLLQQFALALDEYALNLGVCARYGNDQFYILTEYSLNLLENLNRFIKENVCNVLNLDIYDDINLSFGAYHIKKYDSVSDMIDNATLAHKSSKNMGKGVQTWYNQELIDKIYRHNMLEKHMHTALNNHEFKMYLQPKFKIPHLDIIGAEALVRWNYQGNQLLFPDEFIPLFERNGFIYELDFYMFEQVCLFILEHHLENTNFKISVNFSRVSLHHKDFYSRLMEIIQKYKISTKWIELEITESAFNELSDSMLEVLKQLKADGFTLSMDDFGTGYSSLNSMSFMPVDVLKIDKGFLKEQSQSDKSIKVVGLIVEIARTLGMEVICEGIETKYDIETLERLNCYLGQGYYVSKPIPQNEFFQKYILDTSANMTI